MLLSLGVCFSKKPPQSLFSGSFKQIIRSLKCLAWTVLRALVMSQTEEEGHKVTDVKGWERLETR